MTKINKLELRGFKSFRTKTVVPFFDGLTAVIGENGSGKSNLFDAISFVMGRRSSQLRSDRLEHLIFNGGGKQGSLDGAEVVLYLDNEDGVFDQFFPDGAVPEVTLGRRLTRHSSTYTFMGKTCTRGMIDRVLESGSIDPDGQQLIAQGRITEVIKKSPVRRREIIDEVSGIAAYDDKRKKAIVELKDVKSKLNTHRVILAERRRRLVTLEHERDAALEHQQLIGEQTRLEQSIRHRKREKIVEKLDRARTERSGMAERIEVLEAEVAKLDLAVENKEWELEGMRDDLEKTGQITMVKAIEHLRSQIFQKQGEIELARQQARNLQEMIDEVAKIKAAEAARTQVSGSRNRAVQALLERKRGGVYGTIASLSTAKSGFEVAFETAAGGHMNDLVVDSRETAIDCINHLKQNRLGRARILPLRRLVTTRKSLTSADALKLPGVIDYAINLVEFDPKYRRAFEYILSDAIVAENLEALREIDGVRAVTMDGDLQSKGGALTGGWRAGAGKKGPAAKPADASFDTAKRRQQISKLKKQITTLTEEIEELEERLAEQEAKFTVKQQEESLAKGAASTRSDELHALRDKRRDTYRELETLRRGLTRYERQEAEAQAELESLSEEEHDPSYYIEGAIAELERNIDANRRRLRRLEPVNMRAIDEYADYEKEYETFREKVDVLEREKHEIELLIGEIEERKKERFLDTLETINGQFNRIFEKLFEGGHASLELDEPGNISSGLLIKANPPDKEPHVIDSLSGGEQTLVATAFIFALQEYQRAPFFILDEIDAALDLMNVMRLARMLREYAQRIQVIVVSHSEETVRHADRAYGVTIKDGASQILALNLN